MQFTVNQNNKRFEWINGYKTSRNQILAMIEILSSRTALPRESIVKYLLALGMVYLIPSLGISGSSTTNIGMSMFP